MIEIIQSIILGILQGVSEFFPISSSGHLAIFPRFFGWDLQSLQFDVALHFGTAIAVIWYFFKDWKKLLKSLIQSIKNRKVATDDERLIWYIIAASIPAALAGYLLESSVEQYLRHPLSIAYAFIFVAAILFFADTWMKKARELKDLKYSLALVIGLSQIIALIPGISRSGITIAAGRFLGFSRETAIRFSFLLATPIILGAAAATIGDFRSENLIALIFGTIFAAIFGYLAIRWLLNFVKNYPLWYFSIYLVILAFLTLIYFSL